jgi:hypothetical protein
MLYSCIGYPIWAMVLVLQAAAGRLVPDAHGVHARTLPFVIIEMLA